MKSKLFPLIVLLLLFNCNVSKITTKSVVRKAVIGQKVDFETYVNDKIALCKYLALTKDQNLLLKNLFSEEKTELDKINSEDENSLARNIYKYETEFRNILTDQQLQMYKKMRSEFEEKFFYSQFSLNNIKETVFKV